MKRKLHHEHTIIQPLQRPMLRAPNLHEPPPHPHKLMSKKQVKLKKQKMLHNLHYWKENMLSFSMFSCFLNVFSSSLSMLRFFSLKNKESMQQYGSISHNSWVLSADLKEQHIGVAG